MNIKKENGRAISAKKNGIVEEITQNEIAESRLEVRERRHFYGPWDRKSIEETVKGEAATCAAEIAARSLAVAVYRYYDTLKGGYITFVMEFLPKGDTMIKVFVDDGDGMTVVNTAAPEARKTMSHLTLLVDMPT